MTPIYYIGLMSGTSLDGIDAVLVNFGEPKPALLTTLLAELTQITVIADFRSRDIAAEGQGAPLVPAFHKAFFGDPHKHRIIVNIGGIANITRLDPTDEVIGFDCGPGNILMDAWSLRHTGKNYDDKGQWAKTGKIVQSLFDLLMDQSFFSFPPPKSTGRELFNLHWLEYKISQCTPQSPENVQATLLQLTVISINKLGVDADWVEAFAFAWLAQLTILRKPGNLSAVTGAKGERILGAIYPA